jgi:2-polyprenyl-6-methoxyphenol hydroxylase-like FAD-dependent oxidoreductase
MPECVDFDAVIVGAGPAGACAAILLARAGLSVALLERQRFPRRKVCGECIAASNLALLDMLGIGPAFAAAAGPPLRQVALMHKRDCIVADLPRAADDRHPWGCALGRETFDCLLRDQARASGVRILQPWQAVALDPDHEPPRCMARSIDTGATTLLQARALIVANGSWETRGTLREHNPLHHPADLIGFKANFRDTSLRGGLLPVLAFRGGYGGMVVADDEITTVACCIRRDRLQAARRAAPGTSAGEAVERLLIRECAGVQSVLARATRCGGWIAAGALSPGVRLSAADTFFRIGNAAAEAHPIIGEGISMALQSAALLCTHLVATIPATRTHDRAWRRELARRYVMHWRRVFVSRLALASLFAHAAMHPASSVTLFPLVRAWPALLTLCARASGKVALPAISRALSHSQHTNVAVAGDP